MAGLLTNRRVWTAVLVVMALLAVALWPTAQPVDVVTIGRGPLVVTVDEEGETRVRDRFVVSAPVAGRVQRIELEPGDRVEAGTIVARVLPETPALLDARTRSEVQAAIEVARAAEGRARAEEQRAKNTLAQAQREQQRARELGQSGLATRQELDARDAEVVASEDAVQSATFAVGSASAEIRRLQARIAVPADSASGRPVSVSSPVSGVVLRRLRESETQVPAGEPLLEIGDPARLEIVSDLLSTDAVRIGHDARVLVEQWGGDRTLEAKVRRVEPAGFTKVSALGVEEQRVNVIIDFVDPAAAWAALGDAYRVEVRVVLWEAADVLKVPTSALFREGSDWAVYAVRDGRAVRARVQLGRRTAQEAEVESGLEAGALVVLYPGDAISDGVRVQPTTAQGS